MTKANYYSDILKVWHVKLMGEKPTHDLLNKAHGLGCRAGVQALHIAMCLRAEGCTVTQFVAAGSCGPAHNKRRELVSQKLIKVAVAGKPYAYIATLTEKGDKAIAAFEAKLAAGEAEPAKPAKGKGKKAKAAKGAKRGNAKPADVAPVANDETGDVLAHIAETTPVESEQPTA